MNSGDERKRRLPGERKSRGTTAPGGRQSEQRCDLKASEERRPDSQETVTFRHSSESESEKRASLADSALGATGGKHLMRHWRVEPRNGLALRRYQ